METLEDLKRKRDVKEPGPAPWTAQNTLSIMAAILAGHRLQDDLHWSSDLKQSVYDAFLLYSLVALELEREHLPNAAARREFDENMSAVSGTAPTGDGEPPEDEDEGGSVPEPIQ